MGIQQFSSRTLLELNSVECCLMAHCASKVVWCREDILQVSKLTDHQIRQGNQRAGTLVIGLTDKILSSGVRVCMDLHAHLTLRAFYHLSISRICAINDLLREVLFTHSFNLLFCNRWVEIPEEDGLCLV